MADYVDHGLAQFENVNALRGYPFESDVQLVSRDGRTLSRDVVVDVHLVVPHPFERPVARQDDSDEWDDVDEMPLPVVRMSSIHLSPKMVSVCFVASVGGVSHALAATVETSSLVPYSPVRLEKLYGEEDIGGLVTFGDIDLPGFPETYRFDDAVVLPCCVAVVRPTPLRKFTDLRSGDTVSGDSKIVFSSYVKAYRDGRKFTLRLADGAADVLASECAAADGYESCGATPITTINGISPDEHGNIVLWFH